MQIECPVCNCPNDLPAGVVLTSYEHTCEKCSAEMRFREQGIGQFVAQATQETISPAPGGRATGPVERWVRGLFSATSNFTWKIRTHWTSLAWQLFGGVSAGSASTRVQVDAKLVTDTHGQANSLRDVWVTEEDGVNGCVVDVRIHRRVISVKVPPSSRDRILRIPEVGRRSPTGALLGDRRSDALIRIRTYTRHVHSARVSPELLGTDVLANQSRILAHVNWLAKNTQYSPKRKPLSMDAVANSFNSGLGYQSVLELIHSHLGGSVKVKMCEPKDLGENTAGQCHFKRHFSSSSNNNPKYILTEYSICYSKTFESDLETIAAIFSHELCHVVYDIHYDGTPNYRSELISKLSLDEVSSVPKQTLEERVDALVCLTGLSSFQLRAARKSGIVLGYFNQEAFEWMHARLAE